MNINHYCVNNAIDLNLAPLNDASIEHSTSFISNSRSHKGVHFGSLESTEKLVIESTLLKMSNVLIISKCATTFGSIPNEYDHF